MASKNNSKKQELSIVASNALSVVAGVKLGDNIGAVGAETVTDKDGNLAYVVTNHEKDGTETITTYVPTKESATTLHIIDALRIAKTLTDVVQAHYFHLAYSKDIWKDMGYKSFGAFCEGHAGIKGATGRLYSRVGEFFVTEEDGVIDYRKAWLSHVPVTNLFPVLSLVEAIIKEQGENTTIDTVLNLLYDNYINEGKLHLRFAQTKIKDEINAIMGKEGKQDSKEAKADSKEEKQDDSKALPNALTAYGIVEASVSEKLADDDDVEAVKTALALVKAILER